MLVALALQLPQQDRHVHYVLLDCLMRRVAAIVLPLFAISLVALRAAAICRLRLRWR
jgi:hypothetical protein